MTYYVLAAVAALAVGYFFFRRTAAPGVGKAVDEAIEGQDPAPVVEAGGRLPHERQADFYQQAITLLWEGWQRPLAVKVIKAFSLTHAHETICQFWLKQAMEVEPMVAGKEFDKKFLETHYNPEVAACCGKTSS